MLDRIRRRGGHTNPVFYRDQLARVLGDDPRLERILSDPESADLLTWNIFTSLETHKDEEWLAYRLQAFGGSAVRAPVRIMLWTGRDREPRLDPTASYVRMLRQRVKEAGADDRDVREFEQPVEVPVLIETPDVVVLVDTVLRGYPRGSGGRDRLLELIDVARRHAGRLSKTAAVAVVYRSGAPGAGELSARVNELRDPAALAGELGGPPGEPVLLRETSWRQLLSVWEQEVPYLRLAGQPVKAFVQHARRVVGERESVHAGR